MTTKTKIGSGMLQPLMAYRFRVLFGHDIDLSDTTTIDNLSLTQQIAKVDLDLLNKTLHIKIRQSVTPEVFMAVAGMIDHPDNEQTIIIEPLSGTSADALWSIHFTNSKCIHYESSFDYAKSDIFYHKLTFKFHRVITSDPVDWNLYGAKQKSTKIKGTLTPAEAMKKYEKDSKKKRKTK